MTPATTPTADVEDFRAEVRAWLAENAPRERLASWTTQEGFDQHRAWERTLFEGGYAAVDWPEEYGGRAAGLPSLAGGRNAQRRTRRRRLTCRCRAHPATKRRRASADAWAAERWRCSYSTG